MPAWIAGIQVCRDASGDIHVSLDSSTPCWNDAIEGALLKLTEASPHRISKGGQGRARREKYLTAKNSARTESANGEYLRQLRKGSKYYATVFCNLPMHSKNPSR
jgi:hypothetical protein